MKIGKYLESNYIQSNEIMDLIDRIPSTAESPLAYLFKMIENLIQERRQEEKIRAHKIASDHCKEGSCNIMNIKCNELIRFLVNKSLQFFPITIQFVLNCKKLKKYYFSQMNLFMIWYSK